MFVLDPDPEAPVPPRARLLDLPSLSLIVFEGLPVTMVEDDAGRPLGVLLGTALDGAAGGPLRDRAVFEGAFDTPATRDAAIERALYSLTGSFLFVLDRPGARRLYLDACGSLSAVWEAATGRAAAISSQLVAPEDLDTRFQHDMYAALRVDRDGWFPAGLTGHQGIERLMPNHYLDLDARLAVRHWPTAPVPRAADPEDACGRILAATTATLHAAAAAGPMTLALTAGNETRMILTAARNLKADLQFVTVAAEGAELDRIRAEELAARFALPHRLIPLLFAEEAGQLDWQARTGYAMGGPHVRTHPTIRQLRDRPYFIGGLGGEIGRAFFWRATDDDATPLNADGLWARMGMPPHPDALAAVDTWLRETRAALGEDIPTLLLLDLAYIEIRMGCWGFALSYTNHDPIDLHPLIGRESFAAMLSLPPEWRRMSNRTNPMIQEVIRQGWPELLSLPISSYGDWRDRTAVIRRALRQPHLVAKRLRKVFK